MSQVLRQSTQVIVVIGPFVDVTDGFTPETGITLGAADEAEALKANTTTTTDISAATWAAISGCDGYYGLTLSTTHTDTVGALTVMVNDDSVCLPVYARFQVIEEAAYDTIFAASALPASTTNITAGTITTATNVTTVNGLAANVITAASMNADASAEIADAVWDEDATAHQTGGTFGQAIGDPGADTNTIFKAVVTDATGATVGVDVVAIKAETVNILADTAEIGAAGAGLTVLATQASVNTIDGIVDSILLDTAEIGAAGAGLTVLSTQASVNTIDGIVDAILLDTAEIGAAGAGLTAIDLPDQTMNITGSITGNLSGSVGSVTGAVGSVTGISAANVTTGLTEVTAIKAKTDDLTFTVAGNLDSNIQYVNDVLVTGNGSPGTEWGP